MPRTKEKDIKSMYNTDSLSEFNKNTIELYHKLIPRDLSIRTLEDYQEQIRKRIDEEEEKNKKYELEGDIISLKQSNQLLINYHILYGILLYDPRYNSKALTISMPTKN